MGDSIWKPVVVFFLHFHRPTLDSMDGNIADGTLGRTMAQSVRSWLQLGANLRSRREAEGNNRPCTSAEAKGDHNSRDERLE